MIRRFQDTDSLRTVELCKWAEINKSSFYYKSHPGPRGMKPSTHTPIGDGLVTNELVVEQIKTILGMDYCVYGYHAMTHELAGMGYKISHGKVYRLMDENRLLCGKHIRTKGKRMFVKFRRIKAGRPMEYLCLDIRYVWVHAERRWYYQLAIMDVFSRRILIWIFQPSIKQNDVIALMRRLDLLFGLKGVIIRNDNGSQFIAHKVRQALKDLEAQQEFTHVATPEENAYIESFHSIQTRELFDRFEFSSFYDAKRHITKYMYWYNHIRRHGALNWITPMQKWAQAWTKAAVNYHHYGSTEESSIGTEAYVNWVKNNPYESVVEKPDQATYIWLQSQFEKTDLVANLFSKNVQRIGG